MKRVYVDMVGDLFHCGHVSLLKQAKALGDYLIVGLLSDELAQDYKKRPILTLEERACVIEACRYVNEVIPAAPLIPDKAWIKEHKIDVIVHGDDFSEERLQDFYGDAMDLGIFRTVPYTEGISTTEICNRIEARIMKN